MTRTLKGLKLETYKCPVCGYLELIPRRKLREYGHKKWLYCPECNRKYNFFNKGTGLKVWCN